MKANVLLASKMICIQYFFQILKLTANVDLIPIPQLSSNIQGNIFVGQETIRPSSPKSLKHKFSEFKLRYQLPIQLNKGMKCITDEVITHREYGFCRYVKNYLINESFWYLFLEARLKNI